MLVFVNDDVFLSFFLQSDADKAELSRQFFAKLVKGEFKAFTTTQVLLNIAGVLEKENWEREEVATNLQLILSTPNLKVNYKDLLFAALRTYRENRVSFFTAYHVEVMKRMKTHLYASESKDFRKFKKLKKWREGK